MNTRFIASAALGVMILGTSATAFAFPHMEKGSMQNRNCMGQCENCGSAVQLDAEKQQALEAMVVEHRKAMQPMLDEYKAKRMELRALTGNSNATPDYISKLTKDITDLGSKIRTQNETFLGKVKTDLGVDLPPMMGGRGMMGERMMNNDCPMNNGQTNNGQMKGGRGHMDHDGHR